jgi:methionine-rich copper-binding protein CopC
MMQKMKTNLMKTTIAIFLGFGILFSSCEEEVTYKNPEITTPETTNVTIRNTVELSFTFKAEAGFKTSTVTSTKGTATITTDAEANSTNGTIVVTYEAGETTGAGTVLLTVTDKEDQTGTATAILDVVAVPTFSITQNITANTTWTTGNIYILEGRIAVVAGVTLTIQPGVIVKGREGTGSNATALLIARGGKLDAQGTATSPIIFTSVADNIIPGEIASPNLDPTMNGLWGGLLILGKAPISAENASMQIEGIPVSDTNGLYGGDVADDNSGTIRYISIRHGGANIGEGNEINGLTLGGVGSGTTIENVEIISNQDDGIEFFGGTVNVKNLLVWNVADDAVDTDQSWAGTLDNFIVICGPDTDHALEIDGPEGTMLAAHTVKNGSVKGHPKSELGDFRDGARGSFENIYFFSFPDPATEGRGDLSLSGDKTLATFANGALTFSNLQVTPATGVALTTIFKNGTAAHATSVAAGANTVGADKTKFNNWTWASASGQLSSF